MVEMSKAVEENQTIGIGEIKKVETITGAPDIITGDESKEDKNESSAKLQYSREQMLLLEKTDLALLRPFCLDSIYDREGRWDPMAWHSGQPQAEAESVPVGTLEFRKRTRSNAADTKDVEVVLSPQRMSFGNGCAGTKAPPPSSDPSHNNTSNNNTKRLNGLLPKNKFDKSSERSRDPDREKHLQKINGNYAGNREQIRKAIRVLHENREKSKEGGCKEEDEETWIRNSEYSSDYKPEYKTHKDTKYSYTNGAMDRNRRNWDNGPRRNSERSGDDEPEWFTAGPTSRLDTIELKGFEDDDKLHSTEVPQHTDEVKPRDSDPNPEIPLANNQCANESSYSTGLQEDWDPTHPKFNVEALLDPHAFLEEGKDLLEAEKSMNSSNRGMQMEFWAGANNSSSPKDFPNAAQQRTEGSPVAPTSEGPASFASDVHFGENMATSNLKAMLGVNESLPPGSESGGMMPGMPSHGPPPGNHFIPDGRGIRPTLDDPVIKQLLHNDKNHIKPEALLRQQQEFLAAQHPLPRDLREMLHRSEQHLPPPGPMLPHPGPVMTPRHPVPEHLLRDPRLQDHRVIDPRLVDPRFNLPPHLQMGPTKQVPPPPPRNGQDILKMVKNDPAQLDKVISCLHSALKLGTAPPESQPTMHSLLREMEMARNEHIKRQKFQILANAQHQLNKQHHEQIIHDKTQALKTLLRLPGQGASLMGGGPPRMMAGPPKDHPLVRPRITGDESIPTRITNHHPEHRMMMGNKPGFPMAFTPTSVMIKSSEIRNYGKVEPGDVEPNINLTPSHMHPSPARINYRPGEPTGLPTAPNGGRSPQFDDVPKPVPTIETSRGGAGKLQFPPSAFGPQLKGMPGPQVPHQSFMMHQQLKGIPPSPHGGPVPPPHLAPQLVMQELMHSNKPANFNPGPLPPPPPIPNAAANLPATTF